MGFEVIERISCPAAATTVAAKTTKTSTTLSRDREDTRSLDVQANGEERASHQRICVPLVASLSVAASSRLPS